MPLFSFLRRRWFALFRWHNSCVFASRVSNNRKILIVEDNEDCRELQACVIRRLGYLVIEADNGVAAIDEALASHPDLILMDLSMPKMDGDEATVQLKTQETTRDIPVVICTAFGPGPEVNRALNAGAVEVLHKPFKFFDLENLIRKYVPTESNSPPTRGQQNTTSDLH